MKHKLESNIQLSEYLGRLVNELDVKNLVGLAERVRFAGRFSGGSPSEFLHEAQKALREVLAESPPVLGAVELEEVRSIIDEIEEAFNKVGGA